MLEPNQEILLTRQRHEAEKMGLHWDYRLVAGDKAYSFATKKELPEPGKSIVLFEQPVHTRDYALSKEVHIPSGQYGAGITKLDWIRKAKIGEHSTQDQMTIVTKDGDRFLLKRIPKSQWGDKAWLFKNLTEVKEQNKYLEKAALRRAITELAKGTISKPLSTLSRMGVIKPADIYAKGMARGNANIVKSFGAEIRHPRNSAERILTDLGGGYSTSIGHTGTTATVFHKHNKYLTMASTPNGHHGMIRHELFEASDGKRVFNHADRQVSSEAAAGAKEALTFAGAKPKHIDNHFSKHRLLKPDVFTTNNEIVGSHLSPQVLARESEMVRKNPYLAKLREHRNTSGEADTIKRITGKEFGREKMTGTDFRHAAKAKGNAESPNSEIMHTAHNVNVPLEEILRRFNSR